MLSPATVLSEAADAIAKYGHVTGRSGSTSDGFCALGAMGHVLEVHYTAAYAEPVPQQLIDDFDVAKRALLDFLPRHALVSVWNDETDADDVITTLREAAQALASRGERTARA